MIIRRFFMRFPGGRKKALSFSFDDGPTEDAKLIEIMKKYGIKGTFNLNGYKLENDFSIYDGMEIAAHGFEHKFFNEEESAATILDVAKDRAILEEKTGKIIRGMAYPFGTYDKWTVDFLRKAGIVHCRTCNATYGFGIPKDFLELHPTSHQEDPKIPEIIENFKAYNNYEPAYFYFWGHSYEFNTDEKWTRIENICKTLSEVDDVWHATTIEVYDYVNAYRNLVWSMDKNIVYNPSNITVYFSADAVKDVVVKPGETVNLNG